MHNFVNKLSFYMFINCSYWHYRYDNRHHARVAYRCFRYSHIIIFSHPHLFFAFAKCNMIFFPETFASWTQIIILLYCYWYFDCNHLPYLGCQGGSGGWACGYPSGCVEFKIWLRHVCQILSTRFKSNLLFLFESGCIIIAGTIKIHLCLYGKE